METSAEISVQTIESMEEQKKIKLFFRIRVFLISLVNKLISLIISIALKEYSNFQVCNICDKTLKRLKKSDVLHLHWVNGGLISIKKLSDLNCKLVWTLHDEWPISGFRHYTPEKNELGLKDILQKLDSLYLDWKIKNYPHQLIFVAPSSWMLKKFQNSPLNLSFKCVYIPNPIDTKFWKPITTKENTIMNELNLVFVSSSGGNDYRKGGDILKLIINKIKNTNYKIKLNLVGGQFYYPKYIGNIQIQDHGYISSNKTILKIYQNMDIILLPSRRDNLPNVAIEAAACGAIPIANNVGGLSDIVSKKFGGYLIADNNLVEWEEAINSIAQLKQYNIDQFIARKQKLRNFILSNFSYQAIADKYLNLYKTKNVQ